MENKWLIRAFHVLIFTLTIKTPILNFVKEHKEFLTILKREVDCKSFLGLFFSFILLNKVLFLIPLN